MTTTGNRETIQALYEAFGRGDIPAVLASLDVQVEWTEAEGGPYGGTFHGPEAVLQNVFIKLGTEWDGFTATPRQLVTGDDTVVMLGEYTGTYRATGKSLRSPVVHAWTLQDGKIIRFVQYTDTVLFQRALEL
ncbi:nuclear transport factor 2 family protein [Deinococcus oregonensis]|uniref:Nuclear transport factor 2 family protein n=1 Tax=Deinococcus oregonensis TaxID=1805970 RepID=A0ABV6B6B6_9DEIO